MDRLRGYRGCVGPHPRPSGAAVANCVRTRCGEGGPKNAWDIVYCVPKDQRPGFAPKNLRALRLVAVGGVGLIATTVVSSTVSSAGAIGVHIGPALTVLGIVLPLALNTALFAVIFRWLTVRSVGLRDVCRALPSRRSRSPCCRQSRRRSSRTNSRAPRRRTGRSAPSSSCCRGSTFSRRCCCSPPK